ncbi:MAG: hypothetical protein R3E78_11390 [Burkholderiaceae bacterium]
MKDKSKVFNTARVEALEVDNLIEAARAPSSRRRRAPSAAARTVKDYERGQDDPEFPLRAQRPRLAQAHAVVQRRRPALDYKPVRMKPLTTETVPPKVRTF